MKASGKEPPGTVPHMTTITRACLRHRRLVVLAWLVLTLSSAPDVVVEMIATGLGFGILLDAVVVRTLLVPALVAIMGRANWWMPRGLGRILPVSDIGDTGERVLKAPASYRSGDLEDTYPDPSGRRI